MTISYYFFYLKKVQRGINSTNFSKKKNWKKKENFLNIVVSQKQIEMKQSLKKVEKNFAMKHSNFNSFQFHLVKNKIKIRNNISQEIYKFFKKFWKSKISENNYERQNFFQFFICFLFRQNSFQELFLNFCIFFSKILKYEIKKITAFHFLFFQKNIFHSISIFKFLATSFISFPKIKNHQFFLIRERKTFVLFCQQNYLETQNEEKLLSFQKLKENYFFEKNLKNFFSLSSKVEQKNFAFFHFFHTFFRQIKSKQWNSLNFLSFEKNFNKEKGKIFNCFFPKLQYGNISKYFQNSTQFKKFIDSQEFFKFQSIFKQYCFPSSLQNSQIQSLFIFEKKIKNFFLQFFYEKIFYFSQFLRNFQKLRKEHSFQMNLSLISLSFNAKNNALKLKKNILCFLQRQKAKKHHFLKNHFFYSYSTNEKKPFFFASNKIYQCPKEKLIREIYCRKNIDFLLIFQKDISTFQKKKFCIFSPNMKKRKTLKSFELFESDGKKNNKYEISYFQNCSLTLFFLWIFFSSPKIFSKIGFFHSIFCFFLSFHLQTVQKKIFVQNFFKFVQNIGKNFFSFLFENEFFKLKRKNSVCNWNISQKISEMYKKSSVYHIRFEFQKKIESLWSSFLGFPNFSQHFFSFSPSEPKNCQTQTFLDTVYDVNILKKYFFSKKEIHFSLNFIFSSELKNFCESSVKKERNQNLKTIYQKRNSFNGFFPDFLFFEKFEKNIYHFEKILKFRQKKKKVGNEYYSFFFNSEIQYFEFQKESEKQVFLNSKNLLYKNFSPSFFNVHSDFLFFFKKKNFFRISELFSEKKMFKKKNTYFFLNFHNLFLIFNIFPSFRVLLNTQKIFIFTENKKYNLKREEVCKYLQSATLSIQQKILFQGEKNSKKLLFFDCLKVVKFFWKDKFFSFNIFNYKKNIWFIPEKISFFPTKKGIDFFSNISVVFAFFLFTICKNSFFLQKYFLEKMPKWHVYSLSRKFQRKEKRKKREFEIKEKMKLFSIKFSPFFLSSSIRCEKNFKNIFFLKKKPTREAIFDHLFNCKQCIKKAIGQKQFYFMKKLQKIIQSWYIEYKGLGMKEIFSYCDSMLLKFFWNWAKKTHPNKSKYWIRKKYFHQISSNKWFFGKKFGKKFLFLRFHSFIKFFPEYSNTTKRKKKFINQKNDLKFKNNSIEGLYYSLS